MNKTCKFCNKYFIAEGKNSWKKLFCNVICQQEFWSIQRNKTGIKNKPSRDLANRYKSNILTDKQIQICLGGMMGDSSINIRPNGRCRLLMNHCEAQNKYLDWKKDILYPFIIQAKANICLNKDRVINGVEINSTPSYHYASIQHQYFTDLFGLFYTTYLGEKRKRVNMNILNMLQPLAILIWFLDDGCYYSQPKHSSHTMYLSTYRYTLGEHQTMKKWFWHKWRIEMTITPTNQNTKFILRMNKENMIKFNNLFLFQFKDDVPECMHYKFPNF